MAFKSSIILIATTLVLSSVAKAAPINVSVSGAVTGINDVDNLLSTDLGLSVNVGDTFAAQYAGDDSSTPDSSSLGYVYNFNDGAMTSTADFGAGGSVGNINDAYRISILDNYENSGDVWVNSAAIGANSDGSLYILNIIFIDYDQNKHADNSFYFNDTLSGWEFSGIEISQWYGDLDSRNTTLLTSLPSAVPVPAAVWLFGSGLLGLIGVARRK